MEPVDYTQEKLLCFYCDAIFYSNQMRVRHHVEHKEKKDRFKKELQLKRCKHCLKCFPWQYLGSHVKKDHKELPRPFYCTEPKCSSSFMTRAGRDKHLECHWVDVLYERSEVEKYQCKFCKKCFDSFQKVYSHVRQLHSSKMKEKIL